MTEARIPVSASAVDQLIGHLDNVVRICTGVPAGGQRANPARDTREGELDAAERRHASGLMRVNHAGEVAAQALYQGQALTARDPQVRDSLRESAQEEIDHLAWCSERVHELGASVSRLNPLWYAGSFGIGALAGLLGDRVSLGFIAETESQVVAHLQKHLHGLPARDTRSRVIIEQMERDESQHRDTALQAGGSPLPAPVRTAMGLVSKIMTHTAYRL